MQYYTSKIISCGELAKEFFAEGVMVFFNQKAPEELREYSVIHEHHVLPTEDLKAGDVITINGQNLKVLAVGGVANENFRNLGHLVIKFNKSTEIEMEGDVNVGNVALPDPVPNSMLSIDR